MRQASSHKSQMEIMGLAIIVVIIIFGILLSLIFFKPADSTLQTDIPDATLASNLIGVILKTTLDCKDIEIQSLIQDCGEGAQNKEYCNSNDRDPCLKAKTIINESILTKTLDVWKKKYTFRAEVDGGETLMEITNTPLVNGKPSCDFGTTRYDSVITENYAIPLKNLKKVEISLSICR